MLVRISFAATMLVLLCSLANPAQAHGFSAGASGATAAAASREAARAPRAGGRRAARQLPATSTLDCTTRKRRATKPGSVRLAVPAGLSPVTWKSLNAAV